MTDDIYKKLSEKYTDEELAESYVFPSVTSEEEKAEMKKLRFKLLDETTEEQKIYSNLLGLKFTIEDYIKENTYIKNHSFEKCLEEYIKITKKSEILFAQDIDVKYTKLNKILNNIEEPSLEIMYRLEEHSGKTIPAILWWKLQMKKQEYLIRKDKKRRREEAMKVRNKLKFTI